MVAVPISTMMHGLPYFLAAATDTQIRSAPTDDGSSQCMLIPVLTPGPTESASMPNAIFSASRIVPVSCGTTDEITAAVKLCVSVSERRRMLSSFAAYSWLVSLIFVASRTTKASISPSKPPTAIIVFPISTVNIINVTS